MKTQEYEFENYRPSDANQANLSTAGVVIIFSQGHALFCMLCLVL